MVTDDFTKANNPSNNDEQEELLYVVQSPDHSATNGCALPLHMRNKAGETQTSMNRSVKLFVLAPENVAAFDELFGAAPQ